MGRMNVRPGMMFFRSQDGVPVMVTKVSPRCIIYRYNSHNRPSRLPIRTFLSQFSL